jgi:hypothetical protein
MVAEKKGTTPKSATETAAKPVKERKPARTLEQRIAELQAKQAEKDAKAAEKAKAELDAVETAFVKAEAKLLELLRKRSALRTAAGWTADENGDINVPPVTEVADETVAEDSSEG